MLRTTLAVDVTLVVLHDAGRNQNVAANREHFWDRVAAWVDGLDP